MPPSLVPFPPVKPAGPEIPSSAGPRGRRILAAHGILALGYGVAGFGNEKFLLWAFVAHLFSGIVFAVIAAARQDNDGLYGHARGIVLAAAVAFACFSVACGTGM